MANGDNKNVSDNKSQSKQGVTNNSSSSKTGSQGVSKNTTTEKTGITKPVVDNTSKAAAKDTSKTDSATAYTTSNPTTASTSKSTSATASSSQSQDKEVVAKVNRQMAEDDDSLLARIIGLGLILLGIIFIVLAIMVVILSRRDPKVDSELDVPTLKTDNLFTNKEDIKVFGDSDSGSEVMFWLNGEVYDGTAEIEDGEYEFTIEVTKEDEYIIEAAAVDGFPIKRRSEKSDTLKVVVDWTRPSEKVENKNESVKEDGTYVLKGKIEPFGSITLRDTETDEEYSATADKDGNFELTIKLGEGETEFEVIIKDAAGNERVLEEKISVKFDPDATNGGTNGTGGTNGGTTGNGGDLPESAGELDAALDFMFGNRLMVIFGLIALVVFAANSGFVAMKLKRNN